MELQELPTYYRDRIEVQEDGCWRWTGPQRNGYGCAFVGYGPKIAGKTAKALTRYAHRVIYELSIGRKLKLVKEDCDHQCKLKLCVNPAHILIRSRSAHIKRHQRVRFPAPYRVQLAEQREAKARQTLAAWKLANPERWREIQKRSSDKRQALKKEARRILREDYQLTDKQDSPEFREAMRREYKRLLTKP